MIEKNKSLAPLTSWQVGGNADYYSAPESLDQLKEVMVYGRRNHWPLSVLGRGTNVLVSDEGVSGLVIHTHLLNQVTVVEDGDVVVIEAFCGAAKSEILKIFMKYRLPPSIFLAGLPGDMAGGVVMNAGIGQQTLPREFCEIVQGFDVFTFAGDSPSRGGAETSPSVSGALKSSSTGSPTKSSLVGDLLEKSFSQADVNWTYRKSEGWQPGVITKVRVAWPNEPDEEVLKSVRAGNKRRRQSQPLAEPSCGSVFRNPAGDHCGRLIESCGLKGMQIGGAQVSEKHANFIVNKGGATALDIHRLIQYVQKTVAEKYQVQLTNEVVYLGRW